MDATISRVDDVDFYRFDLDESRQVRITAEFVHQMGNIDLSLFDSDGQFAESKSVDDSETIVEELDSVGPSQELADETADMVQNWLIEHIAQEDQQYAPYVKQ